MKLGYLGPIGSYSYIAAKSYDSQADLIAFKSFYEIIKSVENKTLDKGILPIENSTEGAVTSVMDGLLSTERSNIIGEIVIPICHNIISSQESMENIEHIYSHIQAIEQCREYFKSYYPNILFTSCSSTSEACRQAKDKGRGYAAIGNKESAELYGLNIVRENIQDNILNQTRFIIIGEDQLVLGKRLKTSLAFSCLDDRPGLLYEVLREFAQRNINLTRIESRPAKSEMGKYIFYIDFIGGRDEDIILEILWHIKTTTDMLKVFGSYNY